MSVLIIACGDFGCTLKAGIKLGELVGGVTIDGKESRDLSEFDDIVLGTNIRFGKFNKRFYKYLRKLKKSDKRVYIYICGAEIEKDKQFIEYMKEEAPFAKDVRFVWGELDPSKAKFFKKYAIESFIMGRKKDGLTKPRLLDKEIRELAKNIAEYGKQSGSEH